MVLSVEREYRGRKICAEVSSVGDDYLVMLTGGDCAHLGAVSLCRRGESPRTLTFPEHREQVLTEKWAGVLAEAWDTTVTVAGGIHYDHASGSEIRCIMAQTEELLREILDKIGRDKTEQLMG